MRRNNVRGPTSALTEFLRESGISHDLIRRRALQRGQPEAGPSNAPADGNPAEPGEGEQTAGPSAPEDAEDMYTALSKSLWANKSSGPKPPVGGFEKCAKCSKQFTVTKYTMAANPPPGYLHLAGSFQEAAAPRKRKAPAEKRGAASHEERKVPTLVSSCIKIISRHISDVEAFGDIGSVNLDRIIRALCRNRSLTPENATLFYDVKNTNLTIYDGTKLEPPALTTLSQLNPNLTSLRIDFCGHLNDPVIDAWSTSFPALTRLELLGPFLIRGPAWISFFQSHPNLKGFLLNQSPRFDLACMSALANSCPNVTELRLKEVGKLDDTFLQYVSSFKHLEQLDLSSPSVSCSEDGMIGVLHARGAQLTHLDLSGHDDLGDDFLMGGIQTYAPHLVSLKLNNLSALTDEGVAEFFHDIARAPHVGTLALPALLECTSSTLSVLDINSWRETTTEALSNLADAKELRMLDIGWNRAVDDFVIKAILDGCPKLEELKCWGCNRVTAQFPRKRNVSVIGVESHVHNNASY
ncbi:hypothetical protein BC834DRAFT_894448 [Gloeopeniophorella convolvens]|nr:hypothetical protein BC834DRAFT_894448 [Gloeopeniophorella convolvens]